MRVTTSPEALPGSCFIAACGSATRTKYIDTGMSMEWHGAIYVCDQCLAEMARLLGFITPEDASAFKEKIEGYEKTIYEMQRQLDGLEMVIDGFTLNRGSGGVASVPDVVLAPTESGERTLQSSQTVGTGERTAPESVHDEGMAKLSNDESTDFTLRL